MFCKNCGKEIKDTEKYCPYCGVENKDKNIKRQEKKINHSEKEVNNSIEKRKKLGVIVVIALVCIVVISKCYSKTEEKVLNFSLDVVNNTGVDIYAFYASEKDIDNWEEDLLGNEILYDGNSINIIFTITANDLDWDFAMEDMYGNMIEFYGLSFADCDVNGATLILEYDGLNGTATLY